MFVVIVILAMQLRKIHYFFFTMSWLKVRRDSASLGNI